MDGCAHLVLHPLRNVQPVQLVVQEMAESAVVGLLACVADDASGSIQYSTTTTTTTIIILLYSAVE